MLKAPAEGQEKLLISSTAATLQLGGRTILDNVNLKVAEGEIVTIVGPNGARQVDAHPGAAGIAAMFRRVRRTLGGPACRIRAAKVSGAGDDATVG